MSSIDVILLLIIIWMVADLLNDFGNWLFKRQKKAEGFITPPKPAKPERPPGLYKRFDTWGRRNRKKLWAGAIFIWILIFMFFGE